MAPEMKLTGQDFKAMLKGALAELKANIDEINDLNVFPVPDGDTGTNMYETFVAAENGGNEVSEDSACKIMDAASQGALMGARGNSGVILSQFLRGFASGIKGKHQIMVGDLTNAFKESVNTAYSAVLKPVEGTMLTVAKDAAKAGISAIKDEKDIDSVLNVVIKEGWKSLEETPEKLAVLKKAGVVDAGAKGLVVLLEGAARAVFDADFSETLYETDTTNKELEKSESTDYIYDEETVDYDDNGLVEEEELSEYRYCTEFVIKGEGLDVSSIREDLNEYGDSLLAVGSDQTVKIHIHTDNPGVILEYGTSLGSLGKIKIDNMHDQIEAKATKDSISQEVDEKGPEETQKSIGVIAVAAGDGMSEILKGLGVDKVVPGGQTMNPSIEDLTKAANEVVASDIIILPNNSNVILTAEQVENVVDRRIRVIRTKNVIQGIQALLCYDNSDDPDELESMMNDSINKVKAGEVTYAVRNWEYEDIKVNEKDFIALNDGELKVVGDCLNDVVEKLLGEMVEETDEIITLYKGEGIEDEDAEELLSNLQEKYDWCDVEFYEGGQPLYFYLISVE